MAHHTSSAINILCLTFLWLNLRDRYNFSSAVISVVTELFHRKWFVQNYALSAFDLNFRRLECSSMKIDFARKCEYIIEIVVFFSNFFRKTNWSEIKATFMKKKKFIWWRRQEPNFGNWLNNYANWLECGIFSRRNKMLPCSLCHFRFFFHVNLIALSLIWLFLLLISLITLWPEPRVLIIHISKWTIDNQMPASATTHKPRIWSNWTSIERRCQIK